MGFYSNFIFPRAMEWTMSKPPFPEHRQQLLKDLSGTVLEIGFGTGLNLPYYLSTVDLLTIIDANPAMKQMAQKRINESKITINSQILDGENLPMDDNSFDNVVSTWTLCSIANVDKAITEIYRVLKPGGKFVFIEHGLSCDPNVQTWQNRLTPLQKIIADGCHLNRDIKKIVERQFKNISLEEFYDPEFPKIAGYFYRGVAIK